jgi:hypothetical protein
MAFPAKRVMSLILTEPKAVLIITKKTNRHLSKEKNKKDQKI